MGWCPVPVFVFAQLQLSCPIGTLSYNTLVLRQLMLLKSLLMKKKRKITLWGSGLSFNMESPEPLVTTEPELWVKSFSWLDLVLSPCHQWTPLDFH